jgi:transcriptional regulator GlxA family with amidase domain
MFCWINLLVLLNCYIIGAIFELKLIESKLLHGNMRITEIADEFGFTDKSHLNRILRNTAAGIQQTTKKAPR